MRKSINITIVMICIVIAMSGFIGCQKPPESSPEEPRSAAQVFPVTAMTAIPGTFVEYGKYFGEVKGILEVRLTADAKGRVERVFASEGDRVTKGQSLAEIDPKQAQTLYETSILSESIARESYEAEKRFLEQGSSFQLKVNQAHVSWMQARSAMLDAKRIRDSAFAITPISGTVVRRHIEPYNELESGDPTFDVADLSRMKITVDVPETDIIGVRELKEAEVVFLAMPGQVFVGKPTGFSRARSDETLSYEVDVEVQNPDGLILSGQTAQVRLALRQFDDALSVPSRAVMTRGSTNFIFIVREGIAHEIQVQTGVSSDSETVITRGLSVGDQFITEGLNRLADGAAVEISE